MHSVYVSVIELPIFFITTPVNRPKFNLLTVINLTIHPSPSLHYHFFRLQDITHASSRSFGEPDQRTMQQTNLDRLNSSNESRPENVVTMELNIPREAIDVLKPVPNLADQSLTVLLHGVAVY